MEEKEIIYDFTDNYEVKEAESNFVLLEKGDYPFEVIKIEKGFTKPDNKGVSRPKLTVSLRVGQALGDKVVINKFIILSSLSKYVNMNNQFLSACGLLGESTTWQRLIEAMLTTHKKGTCKVGIRNYESNKYKNPDGTFRQMTTNEILDFYPNFTAGVIKNEPKKDEEYSSDDDIF